MTTVVFTPRVIDITEHVLAYAPPEVIVLADGTSLVVSR